VRLVEVRTPVNYKQLDTESGWRRVGAAVSAGSRPPPKNAVADAGLRPLVPASAPWRSPFLPPIRRSCDLWGLQAGARPASGQPLMRVESMAKSRDVDHGVLKGHLDLMKDPAKGRLALAAGGGGRGPQQGPQRGPQRGLPRRAGANFHSFTNPILALEIYLCSRIRKFQPPIMTSPKNIFPLLILGKKTGSMFLVYWSRKLKC